MSVPVEELFSQMRAERPESVGATERERERARVVAQMKSLHVTLVHERHRRFAPRRSGAFLLVAAVVAFAGTALAGAAGHGPAAAWFASSPELAVPSKVREPIVVPPKAPERTITAAPDLVIAAAPSVTPPNAIVAPAQSASRLDEPKPQNARAVSAPVAHAEKAREIEIVNRLFAEAKRARREHREADALALLGELLDKYPRSLLVHEASVERFRALARLGRSAEAKRRAEAYLAAYPKGFAVEEARALTTASSP